MESVNYSAASAPSYVTSNRHCAAFHIEVISKKIPWHSGSNSIGFSMSWLNSRVKYGHGWNI